MNTLMYILSSKPNLLNYYTRKVEPVLEDFCEKRDMECDGCPTYEWCHYVPFPRQIKFFILGMPNTFYSKIFSPLYTYYWRKVKNNQPIVCSKCGLKEDLVQWSVDDLGWKRRNGKWICHRCNAHPESDENAWKEFVERYNEKYRNQSLDVED